MDAVKTLIRTVARSFFSNPKQILIIDALLIHSVLHVDDLNVILATQQKEIRKLIAPLKQAQLVHSQTKSEAKLGQSRPSNRDYYYIHFHHAIDAIKYRVTTLTDKVNELYQPQAQRKDWRCPRCKSEYDTFEVIRYQSADGFTCEKCGHALEETPQAKDAAGMIGHEKHSKLMDQLAKILSLMQQVDRVSVPLNDFETAWAKKKEVPRGKGQHARKEYVPAAGIKVARAGRTGPEAIKTGALDVNLTTGEEQGAADEAQRLAKKAELAKQNMLPVWHTQSTLSAADPAPAKPENGQPTPNGLKIEKDEDEKKPVVDEVQDELAAYLADMKREREEAERKAAEEDQDSDEEDDEDDFEDVISTTAGTPLPGVSTPASSQQQQQQQQQQSTPRTNGLKREYDFESGPSSDANTPAPIGTPSAADLSLSDRESKRVKLENGVRVGVLPGSDAPKSVPLPVLVPATSKEDDEDDEDDFVDVV